MKPLKDLKKDDLMNFVKSVDKKTWGMIAGGVAVAVLMWFFLIEPAWFARPRLRAEMQNMDNQMRQFRILEQKRLTLEANEKSFGQIIQEAKDDVYSEDERELLLGLIARMAGEAKVDIIGSKPKRDAVKFPAPYQDRFEALSGDFMLQGGYHALGNFAAAVESYPRTLRIQTIHIAPVEDTPEKQIAQFSIAAIAHRTAPVKPAASTAGATNAPRK